jgi:uncharacterized membrane protein YdjX (TVP38/TMEM64 family)
VNKTPIKKKEKAVNRIWFRLIIFFLIISGLTFLFYKTGLIHFFLDKKQLLAFLDSLGPLSFIGFVLLQAAQVVAAPIPGELTGLLGGFLYGPVIGVILSTIGLTIGSYLAFSLSRIFGRPFVDKFVDKHIMRRFDYLLHHKGAFLIFLLFLIPGFPKDYLCYILGLGHLTTTEFLVIGGTGRLFGTILLTISGNFILHSQYGKLFILVGITIIIIFLIMAYRDKLERLFRIWHIRDYKQRKAKRIKERDNLSN